MKDLGVIKNLKEGKFGVFQDKLKTNKCFQKESLTKHLRQTLVFLGDSATREKFNFCF